MAFEISTKDFMSCIGNFYQKNVLGKIEGIKDKLDPISVLAMTALIKYKENMTLIGIKGYAIKAEQPSDYDYRIINVHGICRRLLSEGREDLEAIPIAIEKGAQWYCPQVLANENYRKLFTHASEGLEQLKQSYINKESRITATAIESWKERIAHLTVTLEEDDLLPEMIQLEETAEKVKELWSNAEIGDVISLLGQMEEAQGDIPTSEELKCEDLIARLEFLLSQKAATLEKIYTEIQEDE